MVRFLSFSIRPPTSAHRLTRTDHRHLSFPTLLPPSLLPSLIRRVTGRTHVPRVAIRRLLSIAIRRNQLLALRWFPACLDTVSHVFGTLVWHRFPRKRESERESVLDVRVERVGRCKWIERARARERGRNYGDARCRPYCAYNVQVRLQPTHTTC